MNFKYEVYAAKDGYIMDSANINREEQESRLIYQGENMLLITDKKLQIYRFKVITNVIPNKIHVQSIDSIKIDHDSRYSFYNCLEMFNNNYLLVYQIKPEHNKKTKG